MKTKVLILLAASLLISACSNKDIYDNVRNDHRRECEKEVDELARQRCLESAGTDYQTYKRERDKLLNQARQRNEG